MFKVLNILKEEFQTAMMLSGNLILIITVIVL